MKWQSPLKESGVSLCFNASLHEENFSLLLERFPEIAFRYMHEPFAKRPGAASDDSSLCDELLGELCVDTLFIYGIDIHSHAEKILFWLNQKKERTLFIIESDLSQIDLFLKAEKAKDILSHQRISIHFAKDDEEICALFDEIVPLLSTDKLDMVASAKRGEEKQRVESIRQMLFRKTALIHSLCTETLYYHLLVQNILPNIARGAIAGYVNHFKGACKGVPAIICGAGPSLSSAVVQLKTLYSSAVIIAAGSAITALSNYGVRAHIHMAIDPNDEEYARLKSAAPQEVPLFFAPRVNAKIFDVVNAPLGLMSTATGGPLEEHLEKELGLDGPILGTNLSHEALSVTTMAVSLAEFMGCSSIILCGVDLCFTDMQRYVEGVVASSEVTKEKLENVQSSLDRSLQMDDVHGSKVYTLVRWIMEGECFAQFAKQHPHVKFFRGTEAGLHIDGFEVCNLLDIKEKYCRENVDISGMFHQLIHRHPCGYSGALAGATLDLKSSLLRTQNIVEAIIEEIERMQNKVDDESTSFISARQSVFEMDLEEELASKVLLGALSAVLDKILQKGLDDAQELSASEARRYFLVKEKTKWERILTIIESFKCSLTKADIL